MISFFCYFLLLTIRLKVLLKYTSIKMLLKILLILAIMTRSILTQQGPGDIYDEKYSCVTSQDNSNERLSIPSQRRILLISPQKNYLYNRFEEIFFLIMAPSKAFYCFCHELTFL